MAEHADPSQRQLNSSSVVDIETTAEHPASHTIDLDDTLVEDGDTDAESGAERHTRRLSNTGAAIAIGLVAVLGLGTVVGWLGYRAYQDRQAQTERDLFLATARTGAINLTTIDYTHVDADVQRILDSATGTFHDDFKQRSGPFVEVVKQAQSKSDGTVTEAGLESHDNNSAQVLVAVSVKTTNTAAPQQEPRAWRMRISVKRDGDNAKVSNVEFVP